MAGLLGQSKFCKGKMGVMLAFDLSTSFNYDKMNHVFYMFYALHTHVRANTHMGTHTHTHTYIHMCMRVTVCALVGYLLETLQYFIPGFFSVLPLRVHGY